MLLLVWANPEHLEPLTINQRVPGSRPGAPNKQVADYVQQNVATVFGFAQQLTQAKDFQDLVRIQTEFLQTQMKLLTEQAKDLSETATKAVAGTLKGPFRPSS